MLIYHKLHSKSCDYRYKLRRILCVDVISFFYFHFITASGPTQCQTCFGDAASCSKNQEAKVCAADKNSLGTTHCGSAILKMRDEHDRVLDGFIRGCINCAGKITCDKKYQQVVFFINGCDGWCAQDPQFFKNRRKRGKKCTTYR